MTILFLLVGCNSKNEEVIDNEDKEIKNIKDIPSYYDDNGIFKDYYEQAYEKLNNMSIEEKVGQMIFARLPQFNVIEDINTYHLGGFILFKIDFDNKTKEEVKSQISSYQEASKIPLLLGVDE